MKANLLIVVLLTSSKAAFSQGQIIFDNRGGITTTAAPGQVLAPIYREDPADPTHRISGNTPAGVPSGTTFFNGAPFLADGQGPTFTATLWGRLSTEVVGNALINNLLLLENGTTTFRTDTSGILAGIWIQPRDPTPVAGAVNPQDRGTFQVRVWDTRNGAITTWDDVWLPQNNNVLRGYSEVFTVPFSLGDPSTLVAPPHLQGLQSFNVFIVPEPSVLVMAVLAAGCLWLYHRRR